MHWGPQCAGHLSRGSLWALPWASCNRHPRATVIVEMLRFLELCTCGVALVGQYSKVLGIDGTRAHRQVALRRLEQVTAMARTINSDLSTVVQLQGVSSVLTYLEPISVPWILEKAADTVDTHLEGRAVEVTPLVRLPGLHHSINTVRFVFQQAVFAVANEAASCLRKATGRCKYTLVAELAARLPTEGNNSPAGKADKPNYVLIRALTSGCKVSPDMLEELFERGDGRSLGLADVARSVRNLGGDLGASTDGLRAEFWIAVPEDASTQHRDSIDTEDPDTPTNDHPETPTPFSTQEKASCDRDAQAHREPAFAKSIDLAPVPPPAAKKAGDFGKKQGFVPPTNAPRAISFRLKGSSKRPEVPEESDTDGARPQFGAPSPFSRPKPPVSDGLPLPTTPPPWVNKSLSLSKSNSTPITTSEAASPPTQTPLRRPPLSSTRPPAAIPMPTVRPQSWPAALRVDEGGPADPCPDKPHRSSDPSANRRNASADAGSPATTRAFGDSGSPYAMSTGSPSSTSRHGRANAEHAQRAARELGLDATVWGDMKVSSSVVECRPSSADFRRCSHFTPAASHQKEIRKYDSRG